MAKYLEIKFSNGDVFHVLASVIALDRTMYYAGVDGFEVDSNEWTEEFEQSMGNYELKDWMQNNMNWSDIKDHAVKQETEKTYSHDNFFIHADISIIE